MKTNRLIILSALTFLNSPGYAQISIVNGGATSATEVNRAGIYVQNFDSLPNTYGSQFWHSNVIIRGWYADYISGLAVFRGRPPHDTITLSSFGGIGDTDRSLGMMGAAYFGLRLANATDFTITGLDVTFDGEQWERAPNTPQRTDTLYFEYQIFESDAGQLFGTGWTGVEELNFTSPNAIDTTYTSLDGNAEANRIADIHHLISGLDIEPGQEVWLRWRGLNNPGNNHGLGIDNLRVSFIAIPEPSALAALLGTLALPLAATRRRRR